MKDGVEAAHERRDKRRETERGEQADTQNIRQFKSQNWQFILYELTK